MLRPILIVLLSQYVNSSPTMCHCANGQTGMICPQPIQMSCPQPIQMNCPQPIQMSCPGMQCQPQPPCNPFPTLAPLTVPRGGIQGIAQFTLPTFAPFQGSAFGPHAATPIPLPVPPSANGQQTLQSLQNNQQQYPQVELIRSPPPPLPTTQAVFTTGQVVQRQVSTEPSDQLNERFLVDYTTKATTLQSESYVEADAPENLSTDDVNDKFTLYENRPNIRRALAASATKPEMFINKCNDERLKKLIEDNIDSDPSSSKRKIQKEASNLIGGMFDVICSTHDFSYLANTQLYCEAGNDYVTCFAFLHSLIQ